MRFRLLEQQFAGDAAPPRRSGRWSPIYLLHEGTLGSWALLGMTYQCTAEWCSTESDAGVSFGWRIRNSPVSLFVGALISSGRAAGQGLGGSFVAGMSLRLPDLLDLAKRRGRRSFAGSGR